MWVAGDMRAGAGVGCGDGAGGESVCRDSGGGGAGGGRDDGFGGFGGLTPGSSSGTDSGYRSTGADGK